MTTPIYYTSDLQLVVNFGMAVPVKPDNYGKMTDKNVTCEAFMLYERDLKAYLETATPIREEDKEAVLNLMWVADGAPDLVWSSKNPHKQWKPKPGESYNVSGRFQKVDQAKFVDGGAWYDIIKPQNYQPAKNWKTRVVARLLPEKKEDYVLERESDEPGIKIQTNIGSFEPSAMEKAREDLNYTVDTLLKCLWAIRNEDEFYFKTYGKDWLTDWGKQQFKKFSLNFEQPSPLIQGSNKKPIVADNDLGPLGKTGPDPKLYSVGSEESLNKEEDPKGSLFERLVTELTGWQLNFQKEDGSDMGWRLKDALTPKGDKTNERGISECEFLAEDIFDNFIEPLLQKPVVSDPEKEAIRVFKELIRDQKPIPPEIQKVINEHLWNIL